jgi:hypothetical protein
MSSHEIKIINTKGKIFESDTELPVRETEFSPFGLTELGRLLFEADYIYSLAKQTGRAFRPRVQGQV